MGTSWRRLNGTACRVRCRSGHSSARIRVSRSPARLPTRDRRCVLAPLQPAGLISLLRRLAAGTAAVRDESAYWRLVLHYCRQGNLRAAPDEQWHLLWEQDSWSEDASADETAAKCARKLVQVVHPARARVHAEFFRAERGASGATVERDEIRVRTVFALRFGHGRADDGEQISQDAVRAAFNSPFRPFVLTSRSIGQEGLDFHPWCHRLVHWNLPGQSGGSGAARRADSPVQGPCRSQERRCFPC